jgi:prophage DNA circulation protein
MTQESALKEDVQMTSPLGNVFYPLWRNNERSFTKKLGQFNPPRFQGTIVQDLGVTGDLYPLTVYFEGPFHQTEVNDFYKALKEPGQWEVIHPVKGPLILQLIDCTEVIAPIDSLNVTELRLQWIVPANLQRIISPLELLSALIDAVANAIADAQALLQTIKTDLYAGITAVSNALNQISKLQDNFLADVAALNNLANDAFQTAKTSFNAALAEFGIDNSSTDDMSSAMVAIALAPAEGQTDFNNIFSFYSDLNDSLVSVAIEDISESGYNNAISVEFGMTTTLIALAQMVVNAEFASRSEVIAAIENLTTIFNTTVENIENVQENFSDLDIDFQYFSQTETYTSLINLYTLCLQYLFAQFYSLSIEKTITLKRARSPLEITVTEYGTLGENDSNYDLFLQSNNLTGDDILLLPEGSEVVIYV